MRDRRIARTRKAIQNAYLDLLRQKGTEKITISDIAREADIDRKTFYLHYNSTEDIIREFAEEKTRELLEKERKVQETLNSIKMKYGKNAVLKGMNLQKGATARDRNKQIGGHKS